MVKIAFKFIFNVRLIFIPDIMECVCGKSAGYVFLLHTRIQGIWKVTVHFSNNFFIFQILIYFYSYYNSDMVLTTEECVWLVECIF